MRRWVWVVLLCAGCAWRWEKHGSDRFVEVAPFWTPGETTVQELTASLGPPEAMWTEGELLVCRYAFSERTEATLTVRYYLNLVKADRGRSVSTEWVFVFDPDDRLLYSARLDE